MYKEDNGSIIQIENALRGERINGTENQHSGERTHQSTA